MRDVFRHCNPIRSTSNDDRERRQVEKLAAAVRYWELSAELFAQRAEADPLSRSDPASARALLHQALRTTWPALQAQMTSLAPGWLGGAARGKWDELITDLTRRAEAAR